MQVSGGYYLVMRYKITVFVPRENAEDIRRVLGDAGAGQLGEYSYCSFTTTGVGRFKPSAKASPHIGKSGVVESVEEERIEVVCDDSHVKKVIELMKAAHPYEEVAFDIVQLVEEKDL